jgi:DNA-binding response OmpR family regulator
MDQLIQIVEDDADIRFIVENILEDASYAVETFESAKAFFERKQGEKVDLVILDVMFPDGSGIEISKGLKTDSETSGIPVIIMSAHSNLETAFDEGGADGFIQKTV